MGTTAAVVFVVVSAAAIAIVAIYLTTSTRELEKRRRQVDGQSVEPDGAPRRLRPEREIQEDRANDVARERESHRL